MLACLLIFIRKTEEVLSFAPEAIHRIRHSAHTIQFTHTILLNFIFERR